MSTNQPITFQGDFINGKFIRPSRSDLNWEVHSPADKKELVISMASQFDHVDMACEATGTVQ